MKKQIKRVFALVVPLGLLASLIAAAAVMAQAGGSYDLEWWTVAGGGGSSTGGEYTLIDALGQPVASNPAPSSQGTYALSDGFLWPRSGQVSVYLPMVGAGGS